MIDACIILRADLFHYECTQNTVLQPPRVFFLQVTKTLTVPPAIIRQRQSKDGFFAILLLTENLREEVEDAAQPLLSVHNKQSLAAAFHIHEDARNRKP